MKKGYLLLLFACLFAVPAFGVCKHENYIGGENDVQGWMHSYYASWTPGAAPLGGAENENFYIGRVRPLKRFTNEATQVIQDNATQITRRKNRNLLWWCPINESNWTSLPRYAFDSEAFSSWSYVTTHGNWTQGLLRQPGAFADVCHKNGVRTACVSAAAWSVTLTSTDGGHGQNYQTLVNGGYDKLMKLFRYYGIDGLGFNSEQTWSGMRDGMRSLLANCQANKANYGLEDRLNFSFYSLNDQLTTSTSGSMQDFSDFWPSANGFFLNYNWGDALLASSQTNAVNRGGNSFDVYAGMDMQGRSAADWTSLNNRDISIGIWGAHNKCMPYEAATEDGSTPDAIQNCYLRKCEQLFTGGTQNPVNNMTISNILNSGRSNFFGVSKLMAAKSALSWQVNDYFPFISYMNLGVGKFFNNEGETTFDSEWYNIGMQDHLPTWRWWITTSYMGRTTAEVPSDTHAKFTYEDAWFGGSCLKLTFDNAVGARAYRFIQMFKTQFPVATGETYTIRVRYKALKGKASMAFAMSAEGSENQFVAQAMGTMDATEWTVLEANLTAEMTNKVIAQLGMRFNSVDAGTEILIGEVALVKQGVTYNPVAPVIDAAKTKVFKTTSRGVDFKVIWNCPVGETGGDEGNVEVEQETAVRAANLSCTLSGKISHDSRYTNSLTFTGNAGASLALTGLQSAPSGSWYNKTYANIYFDKRDQVLEVQRGENITTAWTGGGEWMLGYVYVDWNNDGDFADEGEYMSGHKSYPGAPSCWQAPAFNIPTDVALGTYTMRYTCDWSLTDNVDLGADFSCGRTSANAGSSNLTAANGGCMVDFELHVTTPAGGGGQVSADAWKSVYNDEVDTWYFEVLGQQEGGEPQLVTATTTWAGYVVEMPFDLDGTKRVRAGVRAVAPDGVTKSEIVWSDYMDASNITIIEGFSVDKPVIKANETFTVSFDDARHAAANSWKIYRSKDNALMGTFNSCTSFSTQLSEKGLYDLEVTYVNALGATVTEKKRAMIQISGEEVGAMPEIYTLDVDNNTKSIINTDPTVTFDFDYTGRPSEGSTSRALRLQEQAFCFTASDLAAGGMNFGTSPFTIAFWFKIESFVTEEVGLFAITSPTDGWPANNWGYIWSTVGPNRMSFCFRRNSVNGQVGFNLQDFNFTPGYWYHVAIASDYSSSKGRNINIFVNGASIAADGYISNTNNGTQNPFSSADWTTDLYAWKTDNNFGIGGQMFGRSAMDGFVDEVQIWNVAKTEADILDLMEHQSTVSNNLKFYWDFETEAQANNSFISTGNNKTAKGWVIKGAITGEGDGVENPAITSESNWVLPLVGAGSPFLAGSYAVNTNANWKFTGKPASQGTPTAGANGADESGAMNVAYDKEGEYTATLTLENDYGKDTRDIQVYVLDGTVDLEGNVVENLSVYPNPFTESVVLTFAKSGNYTVEVIGLDGRVLKSENVEASACQMARIAVDGEAGTYFVRIKMSGTLVQTLKLIKK